ncbi:hypothetical protein [Myroides odoratus]|uniref:hypothetical protein n=1 Tax=Myroides odoratus TaxID=256 RepID=UPI0039B0B9A5
MIYIYIIEDEFWYPIELLSNTFWTPKEVQKLIDGILSTKDSDKDYKYQTEGDGLYIYSNSYAVQFFSRDSKKKESDLDLLHYEFVAFLEDYKAFIEANS